MRSQRVGSLDDLKTMAEIYSKKGYKIVWGPKRRSFQGWKDEKLAKIVKVNGDE